MKLISVLAVLLVSAASPAQAASSSSSLPVTASVESHCHIHAEDVNFGVYDPVAANSSVGMERPLNIQVKCTAGSSLQVYPLPPTESASIAAGAVCASRRMISQTNKPLTYTFHRNQDSAFWPCRGMGTPLSFTSSLDPVDVPATLRIPGAQDASIGDYTDILSIKIVF